MSQALAGCGSIAYAEEGARAVIRRSPRTGLPIIAKDPPERSSRCGGRPPAELLAGIAQFNAGDYWRCHETLETLWRNEPDPIRSLYQGILLVGVGCHHLQRGNTKGALTKLRDGVFRLHPFRPQCIQVDVEDLVSATAMIISRLESLPQGAAAAELKWAPPVLRVLDPDS